MGVDSGGVHPERAVVARVSNAITADDVRLIRRLLVDDLRRNSPVYGWRCLPASIALVVGDLTCAEVRTALVLLAIRCRATGALSVADTRLWIDSAGLRGVRVSVRALAGQLRLSPRHAHRRIRHCDQVVARALSDIPAAGLCEVAQPMRPEDRSERELIETARAECHLLPEPERVLDALRMYLRNRQPSPGAYVRSTYLAGNKDVRYRDANRVAPWIKTIATDPPLPSTTAEDERLLLVCHGVELADDPHEALMQVNRAIWSQQRELLPLLLAHAGRLIPDVGAAGVDTWLSYLHVRYHAAMESEHIIGLRYARALQVDAARHSRLGIGDPRVRRGMSGRGHILQMFGHYDAAFQCYTQVLRHAAHFGAIDSDNADAQLVYRENLHDAHAQLVYTEVLQHGDRARALTAMRSVHAFADDDDRVEIQFTRERRALELALGFTVRRQNLVVAPSSRRQANLIEDQFRRFTSMAGNHPSPNRLLSAHDVTLLYAVLTRDPGLAGNARDAFQRVNDSLGGYANLTDRFNSRLRAAKTLSNKFRDLAEIRGPVDPLRDPHATPTRATGLLVRPTTDHD
ncbi:hypothetical protein ACIA5G_50515 [Amycolatopsis sp. NPDC051758]|uniref:hypothetical protein n=1 Tax=Amycolatopsis sp. NPDC051758 TaxID=3363935 RepID=UPI0037AC0149